MKPLPPNITKCMSDKDRKAWGKGAMSPDECLAKAEAKNEKQLQKLIVSLLNLRGIEVNVSRMDKRKTDRVGWPDLTFCVWGKEHHSFINSGNSETFKARLFACCWEIKMPNAGLSEEQQRLAMKLIGNGWSCRVIRSVDEALAELKAMGL